MTILALAASTRDGSLNRALLDLVLAELTPRLDAGMGPVDRVDYRLFEDLPLYTARREAEGGVPAPARDLAGRIARASALIVVTPEYNHAIPGSLKNGIDWLSRVSVTVFDGRPVLICGASASPYGAWRALRSLRPSLELLGALTLPQMISIGGVTGRPDIEARFADAAVRPKLEAALNGFLRFAALSAQPADG